MVTNGFGGANTLTGLHFEGKYDLQTFLSMQKDYTINEHEVFFKKKLIAHIYKKYSFYKDFLEPNGINWKNHISKRLLPDDSIFVLINNTVFIIECKYQKVSGSVDEKLQTCDFKKKQYQKLLAPLNVEVEYIYILSKWFEKDEYKDVRDYIQSVRCQYYFDYIPLQKLGLPVPGVD